jgi:hypothetical protein
LLVAVAKKSADFGATTTETKQTLNYSLTKLLLQTNVNSRLKNTKIMEIITLDNQKIKVTDSFFSVISKINNFLKIEPILFENQPEIIKSAPIFRFKKYAKIYSKAYNSAFDNGKSLDDCEKIALEKIKSIFG